MRTLICCLCQMAALGLSCLGENSLDDGSPRANGSVCANGTGCCSAEELVCTGNPDGDTACACFRSWDCEKAVKPEKCTQATADTPDGQSGWTCRVEGGREICTRPTGGVPSGRNGWTCVESGAGAECARVTNTPDGSASWSCAYQGAGKTCVATSGGDSPSSPAAGPSGGDSWSCQKDELGREVCKKAGEVPGAGSWMCVWKNGSIVCEGTSSSPPGGNGWTCTQNSETGVWTCTKPQGPGDTPPGGGTWSCTSSSELGGAQCVQTPSPKSGQKCIPGQKRWCDGEIYCGYGIQVCAPDGTWDETCTERADGKRPSTVCACYHFYFNPQCCETPDCIVPSGTDGQICPASQGGYCDYCNPQQPECKAGKCIVTPQNEAYCGQDCAGGKPCPAGSACKGVDGKVQCVPTDGSCYK